MIPIMEQERPNILPRYRCGQCGTRFPLFSAKEKEWNYCCHCGAEIEWDKVKPIVWEEKQCSVCGKIMIRIDKDGHAYDRLLFKKKYAKTKAYVVNDLAVLEYGYQFGLLSDADARPFQHRISGPLVYERDGIRVELNDKGESLFSGYDTNSPHMPSGYWPTFEFYVDVLSEGGWRELTGIGSRTQLPVGRPQETLERALQHIHKECLAVLKADSSVSLKEIGERVSKITPEMFAQSCARE